MASQVPKSKTTIHNGGHLSSAIGPTNVPFWTAANASNSANSNFTAKASLHVTGPARFDDKIIVNGKDLQAMLEKIEKRLSILVPNPKKLAKYEALQKAFDHYKLLEALCEEDDND